ncbi:hypothetical protein [Oryzobacter telluris]|uniref:hypothetical protein n=1 Tax=Oryzobacter telluris TaxID=3149179 RepID=UPI00370D845D
MSTPAPDDQPLLPGAALPARVQQHLRESLTLIRDQAQDPGVRRRIDDVLQGRSSLRDLARDDAFSTMMTPLVERGMARLDALSPQERAVAEADAAALGRGEPTQAERDGAGEPGPASPASGQGTW